MHFLIYSKPECVVFTFWKIAQSSLFERNILTKSVCPIYIKEDCGMKTNALCRMTRSRNVAILGSPVQR